jgi:hypothetical protein
VVWVAATDAEAAAMREKLAGVPNTRVINPSTGFDTGETYSKTHMAARTAAQARGVTSRTPKGGYKAGGGSGSKGGRLMGGLNVVADIAMIHEGAKAFSSDDPRDPYRFQCDYFGDPMACQNGYGLPPEEYAARYGA